MKKKLTLALGVFALFNASAQTAGSLDNTFGNTGKVLSGLFHVQEAYDMALQPDGKIVIAGRAKALSTGSDYNFYAIRLNADGTPDTGFGNNGAILIDMKGTNRFDQANAVAIQPDGKIVLAGSAGLENNNGNCHAGFVRLTANGALDPSFGNGGIVSFPVGTNTTNPESRMYDVLIQPDGKILAAGMAANNSSFDDFALVRLNPDGTLDTDFSNDGKHTVDFGYVTDFGAFLKLNADGSIFLAGNTNEDLGIVKLFDYGAVDNSFGVNGKMTIDTGNGSYYLQGVAWQPDGKILAAGRTIATNSNIKLNRYNPDGTVDTSFGTDGAVETDVDSGSTDRASRGLLIQSDGKIIVTGEVTTGSTDYFVVLRYLENGVLDNSFSNDGQVLTSFGVGFSAGYCAEFQPDGKLLVAGTYGYSSEWDVAVARYATGTLSTPSAEMPSIVMYPNPAQDVVFVSQDGSVKIFELTGKKVLQANVTAGQPIDVTALSPGTYLMEWAGPTGTKVEKLIKK